MLGEFLHSANAWSISSTRYERSVNSTYVLRMLGQFLHVAGAWPISIYLQVNTLSILVDSRAPVTGPALLARYSRSDSKIQRSNVLKQM